MKLCFVLLMLLLTAGLQAASGVVNQNGKDLTAKTRLTSVRDKDYTPLVTAGGFLTGRRAIESSQPRRRAVKRRSTKVTQSMTKVQADILTDQSLWGEDFPSVLAALPAFRTAGEQQVAVFPNQVLGRTKYKERGQPAQKLARFASGLKAYQNLTPRSAQLMTYMAKGRTALTPTVFLLQDDRTFRISAAAQSVQFLAPGLSIADVEKRLGKAEKITTEVLDDGTERRPVILTLHHYAGGAVIFAESDINPSIGSVDRVFLDVLKISALL